MSELWWSSDLHLGHVRAATSFRSFADADEMNEWIITHWNETVAPDDEVTILGDLCMGQMANSLPLVARLHGRKSLCLGNHDRPHPSWGKKVEGWKQKYLDAGLGVIFLLGAVLIDSRMAVVSHFPYHGDHTEEERYADYRPKDDGERFVIHGHVHNLWRQRGRQINVGVDAWSGVPVHHDVVADLVRAGPNDLEPLEWVR